MSRLTSLPANALRRIASHLPPAAAARLRSVSKNAHAAVTQNNVGNRTNAAAAAVRKARAAVLVTKRRRLLAAALRAAKLWRAGEDPKDIELLVRFKNIWVDLYGNNNNNNRVSSEFVAVSDAARQNDELDVILVRRVRRNPDAFVFAFQFMPLTISGKEAYALLDFSRKKLAWFWLDDMGHPDPGMQAAYEPLLREVAGVANAIERMERAASSKKKG